ncbi:MAG: helix-hairpin-helix domain-containing protein [Balneolaceae bacterium]|nr:helix-hairpin-helix domain-containing protein [Balneolaceae bacterium]
MNKQRIKRSLFFWVDRLQIRKRERYSITLLLLLFVILALFNVFRKEKYVPEPENHAQILADFEQRSALIQREKLLEDQKYAGISSEEPMQKEENSVAMTEPISINTATLSQLTDLPGIGNTYAQRIIEYRETNGDFTSVDELVNVKGIGERTLEKIKPFIKL